MEDRIKFERKAYKAGESIAMVIPMEICKFLDIQVGDTMVCIADSGKKGKYGAFWKKEEVENADENDKPESE